MQFRLSKITTVTLLAYLGLGYAASHFYNSHAAGREISSPNRHGHSDLPARDVSVGNNKKHAPVYKQPSRQRACHWHFYSLKICPNPSTLARKRLGEFYAPDNLTRLLFTPGQPAWHSLFAWPSFAPHNSRPVQVASHLRVMLIYPGVNETNAHKEHL